MDTLPIHMEAHVTSLAPFSLPGTWLKAALHTHTTQSDGLRTPEEAIAFYRSRGYHVLAITDHWIYTPGDGLPAEGLTLLPGVELHGPGYHMLALGLNALPDRDLSGSPSDLAAEVARLGGLPYIAHPYWTGQTSSEIAAISHILGIEVYNAVCDVTRGLGYSRVHWDELLAAGHRLTGLAVDDVHWGHGPGAEGVGYVMVRAAEPSVPAILDALRSGAFYASTGPDILDLSVDTIHTDGADLPALRVSCSPCRDIVFYARGPLGQRFTADHGDTLTEATLAIQPDQIYLRVECHDGHGGVAWSNPVYISDLIGSARG